MRWKFTFLSGLTAVIVPAIALAQNAGGYGDYVDWEGWSRVVGGERAALVSSWDRTGGNDDLNYYASPAGYQTGSIATVAGKLLGPGIIYRFWMPHRDAANRFAVRMFFDGESTPRINTDSQRLLDGSFGYFDPPLVDTFAGGQTCYEPIPFRDSVRIDTQNKSGKSNYYQYSARLFTPGTSVSSYTSTLDASEQSARSATVAMFANVGQHPAGPSATSVLDGIGATVVPGGETATVAELDGPGLIRRLTVRMDGASDDDLDSLRLRVFYDGQLEPSIDSPVGWFFGAGHGRALYKSLPLGTDSPDGFYCYWPMPFHIAVRIELLNASMTPIHVDAAVVEHEVQAVTSDAGYLHVAAQSMTRPVDQVIDVLATATGAGHYVGNLLYVQQASTSMSFLQGDDLAVVDAADSLRGTGLEDAYNGGHYYNWSSPISSEPDGPSPPYAIRPLYGILSVEHGFFPAFSRTDQYRWMIGERVPFSQSLQVSVETQYADVGSLWTSVAFWYQLPTGGTAAAPLLPEAAARRLELRPVAPNPVVGSAMVRFWLAADMAVTIELLDVSGRKVQTIVEDRLAAGSHAIRWTRGTLPSGVYFLRLRAGDRIATRKLVLAR